MAITPMRCPFNQKLCQECQLFRGRHYYLSTCEHYRGYIKTEKSNKAGSHTQNMDMASIKKQFEPWSDTQDVRHGSKPNIKIKVVDREAGTEDYCELGDTKSWDWKNKFLMRMVNGKHVTSWEEFAKIVYYHESKGTAELVVYAAPTFMVA